MPTNSISVPADPSREPAVDAIRHFHRFFTRQMAFRGGGLLWGPFSLTEARVIFEIGAANSLAAKDLSTGLGLDAGYISRLLRRLESTGLVARRRSESDGRRRLLSLTDKGRGTYDEFVARARKEAGETVAALECGELERLLGAMRTIESLLGGGAAPPSEAHGAIVLRDHRPGDMGWILHRHALIYQASEGWGAGFEVKVAEVLLEVMQGFDRERDRSFIAEVNGRIVGSIFVVHEEDRVARLRLLYVESEMRGRGLGARLVDEVIAFAREAGYERIVLWTTSNLEAARRIYARTGFVRTEEVESDHWGSHVVDETWELDLTRA